MKLRHNCFKTENKYLSTYTVNMYIFRKTWRKDGVLPTHTHRLTLLIYIIHTSVGKGMIMVRSPPLLQRQCTLSRASRSTYPATTACCVLHTVYEYHVDSL